MTGALHSAALTVAAITYHGFALLFLFYHTENYCGDNTNQYGADNDRPNISDDPIKHIISP